MEMPKGQPNSRVPLAVTALLAPFVSRQFAYEWEVGDGSRPRDTARVTTVSRREQIRAWLTETRQLAAAVLADGWERPRERPAHVHPQSPAWRGVLSRMRPLQSHERSDFETTLAVADDWLAKLEHADENTVGVLWQAMTLSHATSRADGALLFRLLAPDQDDATAKRRALAELIGRGREGLKARWGPSGRKVSRKQVEQAARDELAALRARKLVPAWSKVCDSVGQRFGISGRRVRELLKDSRVRPRRPR